MPRLWVALVVALALVLVAGLRDGPGTDFRAYERWYSVVLPHEDVHDAKDLGFSILGKIVLNIFGGEPVWMFLAVSALTCVPIVLTLRAYARPFALGLALYVLSGLYFFSFNGVRQALAGAAIFAGSRFLFERRWKVFVPIVLLSSLFHASALVFIPISVIASRRVVSLPNMVAVLLAGGIVFFYEQIVPTISAVGWEGRFGEFSEGLLVGGDGANGLRMLVRFVIFGIAFICRKEIGLLLPSGGAILINLSLVSSLLYLISWRHWIFARVAFYPGMYEILLLPLVTRAFSAMNARLVYAAILVSFVAYCALLLLAGESDLLPYRSVLG